MTQTTEDLDFGVWKKSVSEFLHGGVEKFEVPPADLKLQNNTDVLAQMNSSMNANQYIAQIATLENARVTNLDAKAKRDVYRLREQSLSINFGEHFYSFLAIGVRVIIVSTMLVFGVLVLTATNMITPRSGVILGVLLMVVTGIIIMAMSASAAARRNDNWGHYYWNSKGVNGDQIGVSS